MKILTLNTHSLEEPSYEEKLQLFAEEIIRTKPDVFGLQEVNQLVAEEAAEELYGFVPVKLAADLPAIPVKRGNHALRVAKMLTEAGLSVSWTWVAAKVGYDKYDEGLALFSLGDKIEDPEAGYISECRDYSSWIPRGFLQAKIGNARFGTVHMCWWIDKAESFVKQWEEVQRQLAPYADERIYLMGDFNNAAEFRGQGYDLIGESYKDTFLMAKERIGSATVEEPIDGWRGFGDAASFAGDMRIDLIWCNEEVKVARSEVKFDGKNGAVVSDHYGVQIEV